MNWLSTYCMLSHGSQRALVLIAAGAASALSVPPLFFLPALFVGFPILVWMLDGAETLFERPPVFGPSFFIGFWFGLGYFSLSLHWVGAAFFVDGGALLVLMPFAVLALSAALALFWGVATRLAFLFWRSDGWRIVVLAASFGLVELARGFVLTGFPFNPVGIAFTANPDMMQVLSLIGIDGLTPLAILAASSPALIWPADERRLSHRLAPFFAVVLAIVAQLVFGQYRQSQNPAEMRAGMQVRIVQPAIAQATKWQPGARDFIERQMLDLSASQSGPDDQGLAGVTHLIWPEVALPFYLDQSPLTWSRIAQLLPSGTSLVTGMPRREFSNPSDAEAFNAILLIDDEGELVDTYDKVHLVPVGEFLPFKPFWDMLGLRQFVPGLDGWTHGSSRRLLSAADGAAMLPLICYEAVFSSEVAALAEEADLILNLTNDAWFDGSIGPAQHAHHALLRSVEYGLPMLRSANSGHTFVADALGRKTAELAPGAVGVLDAAVPARIAPTLYSRIGIWMPLSVMLALALLAFAGRALGGPQRQSVPE